MMNRKKEQKYKESVLSRKENDGLGAFLSRLSSRLLFSETKATDVPIDVDGSSGITEEMERNDMEEREEYKEKLDENLDASTSWDKDNDILEANKNENENISQENNNDTTWSE